MRCGTMSFRLLPPGAARGPVSRSDAPPALALKSVRRAYCRPLRRYCWTHAQDDSRPSEEPSSSNRPVDTGLLPILGSMLAILASVSLLYVAAFSLGSGLIVQFKDQIGAVMKKDFVPYSERKALEYQLMEQRMLDEGSMVPGGAAGEEGAAVPRDQDFLTLLPS